MSKLVELLENRQKYDRLNKLSAHSPNTATPKEFSVRNQSDLTLGRENIIKSNSVDFFGNTYQTGFDAFRPTLSVTGFRKATEAQNSNFTGNPVGVATTENNAFDSYNRFANDSVRKSYDSKLVHKYLATNSEQQYKTERATAPGLVLTYNV
jgi:hypothetical protein